MGYLYWENGTERLVHPILGGMLRHGSEIVKVRLDDRGDLCVYVVDPDGADDACEVAEEHAARMGWYVDPDDVATIGVEDDERDLIFRAVFFGYTERDLEHMAEIVFNAFDPVD